MDLLLDDLQAEIASSAAAFLAAELPMPKVRELSATPSVDRRLWRQCADLGWFGLGLAEHDGGAGCGAAEEALLFRELGRHLAPGPFLPTVLAAHAAVAVARPDIADAVVSGTTTVGLAHPVGDSALDVYDAPGTDLVLVVAPDRWRLLETVALGGMGSAACLDPTSRYCRVPGGATPLAAGEGDQIFWRGAVLAAAMACGIAESARDMSAEHARTRVQFGRPIGVNQAIKHACTDMAVRCEAATSQTFVAAMTLETGRDDAAFQVSAAKIVAVDAALRNARANVQVHGGMGFTWEHDAHLLVKRTHLLGLVCGDRRHHLAELLR